MLPPWSTMKGFPSATGVNFFVSARGDDAALVSGYGDSAGGQLTVPARVLVHQLSLPCRACVTNPFAPENVFTRCYVDLTLPSTLISVDVLKRADLVHRNHQERPGSAARALSNSHRWTRVASSLSSTQIAR